MLKPVLERLRHHVARPRTGRAAAAALTPQLLPEALERRVLMVTPSISDASFVNESGAGPTSPPTLSYPIGVSVSTVVNYERTFGVGGTVGGGQG